MPNIKRTPLRTSHDSGRRPVRPIDREKMRPWLERHLDKRDAPGVRWVDRNEKIFEIPWRHAARHGWSIEKDACIFERWAIHTKKYIVGKDKEKDPKRWKANFRCALNSLPDVERMPGSVSKGSNAVRRYKFLTPEQTKAKQCKARRSKRKVKEEEEEEEIEEEEENDEMSYIVADGLQDKTEEEESIPSPRVEHSIPNFEKLFSDSDVVRGRAHSSTNHMSGCHVLQRHCTPPPSPEPRSISPNSVDSVSDSEISHYSDEEAVETIWAIENECALEFYHPSLWNLNVMDFHDDSMVANQVELETTEMEVNSVITLSRQPDYWDITANALE